MSIFLIGLFIIIGIVIVLFIFIGLFIVRIKLLMREFGYTGFRSIYNDIKQSSNDSFTKEKSIGSQTNLLLPKILKDIPNFSVDEMYRKTETCIRAAFNSLENKSISDTEELVLMRDSLKEEIEDMISNNINVRYDNIKFHKHGIKFYSNKDGVLNITVCTSLEYDYERTKDGKMINNHGFKKQDRITSKFIYVYDPDKYTRSEVLIGITCPNCGAPVKDLGNKVCRYCNSGLEDINLKSWHMVSYKSDF